MQVLYTTPEKMRSLHDWAKEWRKCEPRARRPIMHDMIWWELKDLQGDDTLDLMKQLVAIRTPDFLKRQREAAMAYIAMN